MATFRILFISLIYGIDLVSKLSQLSSKARDSFRLIFCVVCECACVCIGARSEANRLEFVVRTPRPQSRLDVFDVLFFSQFYKTSKKRPTWLKVRQYSRWCYTLIRYWRQLIRSAQPFEAIKILSSSIISRPISTPRLFVGRNLRVYACFYSL